MKPRSNSEPWLPTRWTSLGSRESVARSRRARPEMTATTVWGRSGERAYRRDRLGKRAGGGRVVDERRERSVVVAADEKLRHARDAPDRRAEVGLEVLPGRRPNGFHPPHDRDAVCYQAVPMQPAHSKFAVTPRPQAKPRAIDASRPWAPCSRRRSAAARPGPCRSRASGSGSRPCRGRGPTRSRSWSRPRAASPST